MFLLVPCTITIITSKAKIPIFLKKLKLAFDANSARQHAWQHAKIRLFFRILAHLMIYCAVFCVHPCLAF